MDEDAYTSSSQLVWPAALLSQSLTWATALYATVIRTANLGRLAVRIDDRREVGNGEHASLILRVGTVVHECRKAITACSSDLESRSCRSYGSQTEGGEGEKSDGRAEHCAYVEAETIRG